MTDNASAVSPGDIRRAYARVAPHILRTPLLRADPLDALSRGRVHLKAECLQGTGSFKLRGALNHILSLEEDERRRGVVAYSSGNHAQGVARAARLAGVPALIVMPKDAPAAKIARTRRDGAEVVLYDRETESREEIGGRIAGERGARLVPPFDHPLTVAGQGTAGLEMAEDLPKAPDQVLVCASGGGLAAGIGCAVRERYPEARIIVVEPEGFDDLGRSLASGRKERNTRRGGSVCDALLVETPGVLPLAMLRAMDATGVTVSDEEALGAVAYALEELKVVLEPGGAVALAAILSGRVKTEGLTTAAVLSGGNADPDMLLKATKITRTSPRQGKQTQPTDP